MNVFRELFINFGTAVLILALIWVAFWLVQFLRGIVGK